ncbi:MAG: hypothetical protein IPQ10_09225 [Saprospiraceae bacterium]|nr:hypothetical protein [Saprospiraceae bacterium]
MFTSIWFSIVLWMIAPFLMLPSSCKQHKIQAALPTRPNEEVTNNYPFGKNIDFIFQDKKDRYWIASNADGVFRYDGNTIVHFTDSVGFCFNYVWSIQEDTQGNLWFAGRDGICRYDGIKFSNFNETIASAPEGKLNFMPGDLIFAIPDGKTVHYDGKKFTQFKITPETYIPERSNLNRPYALYSYLRDQSGKIWFGTQSKGVCVYDGYQYKYMDSLDLGGPAVRTILADKNGNLWFGNNGGGLFQFDGKHLINITEKFGLGNQEFLRNFASKDMPTSMARVFAINEDTSGNIWVGTADAGIWRYDGKELKHYTVEDGLCGYNIIHIFKNRTGDLWFVCNGQEIMYFDGQSFRPVIFLH